MIGRPLSRRDLWRLLGGVATLGLAPWRARAAEPYDQGIGGTGAAPSPEAENGDRGIGGTGVVGTIRKFGSIYVNDLRIAYPDSAPVRIDGASATVRDLKIGQVVRVVAIERNGDYSTGAINVESEAAGPVDSVSAHAMTVLGQTVSLDGLAAADRSWRVGDFVAVYGLRRPDGTIVASLVSPRPKGLARLAGPVRREANGALMIGGVELRGLDPALVGRSAVVSGQLTPYGLDVVSQANQAVLLRREGVRQLLIEAYVERRDGGLQLGSGLHVSGAADNAPESGAVRAIVRASIGAGGAFRLDSFRPIEGGFGGRGSPHGGGGRGPGGGHGRGKRGFRGRLRSLGQRFNRLFRGGRSGERGFQPRGGERGRFGGGPFDGTGGFGGGPSNGFGGGAGGSGGPGLGGSGFGGLGGRGGR